jgi:hypothetical protein
MKFKTMTAIRARGLCVLSAILLTACGGGGGGDAGPSTSTVATTVIDGAIKNATVCLDKNNNGICDAGEPSGNTDANGKANITVDNSDVGKYPLLAVVGTDAIDADTGAVLTSYVMKAPADQTGVVSPLTTLVQTTIESTGATTEAAVAAVKAQTGLNISPLADFTKDRSNPDQKAAQVLANAVVVTTQEQSKLIAQALGQATPTDKVTVTRADLDKLAQKKVAEMLTDLVVAATDPGVQSAATAADRIGALKTKASALLATNGVANASGALAAVEVNKQMSKTTTATETIASAGTSSFSFSRPSDYFVRIMSSTVAQNTADSNNQFRYRENRFQAFGVGVATWGSGSSPKRGGDLHWNGSVWRDCPVNWENTQTAKDASGNASYNYCDSRETGFGSGSSVDISGKSMTTTYQSVRDQGYTNLTIGTTDKPAEKWLGSVAFPAGSKMTYSSGTALKYAFQYYPSSENYVYLPEAKYAAGDATACKTGPASAENATLEQIISELRGTPCVNTPTTVSGANGVVLSSGSRNEGWGVTTLSLGTIGSAATTNSPSYATSFYTGNIRLRAAFGSTPNSTLYYQCQQRYDGGTWNCTHIGTGTYAIQTLGDKRVMTFSGLPQINGALDYDRVLIESDRHVYLGYQNHPGVYRSARFNLTALNAVASTLGIPSFDPNQPVALTALSYQGQYGGTIGDGTVQNGATFNFNLDPAAQFTYGCSTSSTSSTGSTGSTCASPAPPTIKDVFRCSIVDQTTTPATNLACDLISLVPRASDSTIADLSVQISGTNPTIFLGTINYATGVVAGTWKNTVKSGSFNGKRI